MKRNWVVIGVLAVALAVMVGTAIHQSRSTSGPAAVALTGSNVGGILAPDFTLTDIKSGQSVRLVDFRGRAVLLNFWATWCPPCKVEIPWFIDLQKQYGAQGLAVIGVAMDDVGREKIAKFDEDMSINYPVLQGTEAVGDAYGGVPDLPTTFYIGRDGKIVTRVLGLRSHADVEKNIKLALAQGQPSGAGGR